MRKRGRARVQVDRDWTYLNTAFISKDVRPKKESTKPRELDDAIVSAGPSRERLKGSCCLSSTPTLRLSEVRDSGEYITPVR